MISYKKTGLVLLLSLVVLFNFLALSIYFLNNYNNLELETKQTLNVLDNENSLEYVSAAKEKLGNSDNNPQEYAYISNGHNNLNKNKDTSIINLAVCGNSIIEGTEECDDGNDNDNDKCTNDCKNKGKNDNKKDCGKGIGSPDKECRCNGFDFGIVKYECGGGIEKGSKTDNYDITLKWNKCNSASWTANPAIDGVLSKEATIIYTHDGGITGTIEKTLKYDISHITFCGNEIPEPICGNEILELEEECDEGDDNGVQCIPGYGESCTYCSETCEEIALTDGFCGDGTVDVLYEECDDSNNENSDGCDANCVEEYCGDNIINNINEQCEVDLDCDDQNENTIDTCNQCSCEYEEIPNEPLCGDGNLDLGEECDDGNENNLDECRNDCTLPYCGDGIIDILLGEECESDLDCSNLIRCSKICVDCKCEYKQEPYCGDNNLDEGEEC
ncbi:MAG TPA: DUF4215 domain-containing protein, partial [Candidatus Nanoarchaeia archaeon]|nr:DUF4215 domain-containing protein [Candidatus Nanoarchaeia archaeon]